MEHSVARELPGASTAEQRPPLARRDNLVVTDAADEVLVYDLQRHQAHCLNRTAALVWRSADGQRSVSALAALLEESFHTPTSEAVVWLALRQLGDAHLLNERTPFLQGDLTSRRALLRRASVGLVAGTLLLPAVQSIVAPRAAQAASAPPLLDPQL